MQHAHEPGAAPGDIGRRVARRRAELGLSREEVAAHAGMAAGYVAYVEEHPPLLSRWSLNRLADALRTSPEHLLGADSEVPPGTASTAVPAPELRTLSTAECQALIAPGGVGRIAFTVPGGPAPTVLPVNYAVADAAIVFRTSACGVIATHLPDAASFQVDRLDGAMSEGWSVLVSGRAERVGAGDGPPAVPVRSWAGADRDTVVRVVPVTISGRRITARGAPDGGPAA
ncbi:nitroimidazol reductase NimA-like FMN-containing flavoprotein (pyridoxamine 5'-phosphate oxidase superfamily) [Murinocardiopsis flavida]|uniref:Nitroimidazol reductase NimA-like FMN-containing flavoprotein (Pyridoxamine 5'-phosphate oxidase superfamily) n=1 Tax=Murinocardiopsis flavida TaxID=645275 RepID=A0A2P8DKI2_9ACTN|nr:pyridoxamine 5'-phosphate oxidase family protein [Murinocardiopsis flavida]PSK97724.1 nitroimidazol reductase NimA-like FMN-containing flavoprotein (pyridoxamine 5'-phosphate oxidase superfamily) [Murinocardiopsis flavida]